MSDVRLLVTVFVMAALSACGPTGVSSTTAASNLRRIILYNEDGKKNVALMKDTDALTVLFNMMKSPSDETKAQFQAAKVEGKIFQVDSGTKAVVLKEVPLNGVPGMSIMRIRISNGPHETEEALCFSTDAQPDNTR
jgi:hypothetical protein